MNIKNVLGVYTIPRTKEQKLTFEIVKRVLKKDKGLPMTMLHIELYEHGYRGDGEVWITEKPMMLLNIEEILEKIFG